MSEEHLIIRVKKDNKVELPESIVKLYKIKEGDFFIVDRQKWNHILFRKSRLVEK